MARIARTVDWVEHQLPQRSRPRSKDNTAPNHRIQVRRLLVP
jgi:hypothetical protein